MSEEEEEEEEKREEEEGGGGEEEERRREEGKKKKKVIFAKHEHIISVSGNTAARTAQHARRCARQTALSYIAHIAFAARAQAPRRYIARYPLCCPSYIYLLHIYMWRRRREK